MMFVASRRRETHATRGSPEAARGCLSSAAMSTSLLHAYEINWVPLLGCLGLGGLWCLDTNEDSMVIGAGAVCFVVLGRVYTSGSVDVWSIVALSSVVCWAVFERLSRPPGQLRPDGEWTWRTDFGDAKAVAERRASFARVCASGQLYVCRRGAKRPEVLHGFDAVDADRPDFDACVAALPPDARAALARAPALLLGPSLLCSLASAFQVAFLLREARYVVVPSQGAGTRLVVLAVATDGAGDPSSTFLAGFASDPVPAAAAGVVATRWRYRCGPPRDTRGAGDALEDAEAAAWWATAGAALLAPR